MHTLQASTSYSDPMKSDFIPGCASELLTCDSASKVLLSNANSVQLVAIDSRLQPATGFSTSVFNNQQTSVLSSAKNMQHVCFSDLHKSALFCGLVFILLFFSCFRCALLFQAQAEYLSKPFTNSDSRPWNLIALHHRVRQRGCYNFEGVRIPLRTAFNLEFWQSQLSSGAYHDQQVVTFLTFGWPINYSHVNQPRNVPGNHKSASDFAAQVDEFIAKEAQYGALVGPFSHDPFKPNFLSVSPLQTVAKKGSNLARRIVVDLSFPPKFSINSGISKDTYLDAEITFQLPSIDDFARILQHKGRGSFMFKRDLSRAYRQIPIDPFDYNLLGIMWRDSFYFDTVLPFGLRSAAFICQRVTSALSFIQIKDGFESVNYIDDFGGAESSLERALQAFDNLKKIFQKAGVSESTEKAVPPAQIMTFLGIGFDTRSMTMFVSESRLLELKDLSFLFLNAKKLTKTQLQSIIGKLMFAAKCVPAARVFMNRLFNALRKLHRSSHHVRITADLKKDLFWWSKFLPDFNGRSLIPEVFWSETDSLIQCDACLSGAGAVFQSMAFHAEFPEFIMKQQLHINALEFLTLIVALKLWAHQIPGKKISLFCDNMATVQVINSGFSRDLFMQTCLRELVFVLSVNNVQIRACHITGSENRLADFLSRWHLGSEFKSRLRELRPDLVFLPVADTHFRFSHEW